MTTATAVAAAFGGKVSGGTADTTGTGNPTCQFTLTGSNVRLPGVVTITVNRTEGAKTFQQTRRTAHGAAPVGGVGDAAYYLADTSTLRFVSGRTVVSIQAWLRVPGESQRSPGVVRADIVGLAKTVAAEL